MFCVSRGTVAEKIRSKILVFQLILYLQGKFHEHLKDSSMIVQPSPSTKIFLLEPLKMVEPETHIKVIGDPARLAAQLAERWGQMN
jgi:hypothetical protein